MFQFFANVMPASDSHPFWRWLLDRKADDSTVPRFRNFGDNLRNFAVAGIVLKGSQVLLAEKPDSYFWVADQVVHWVGSIFLALCAFQLYGLCDLLVFYAMRRIAVPSGRRKAIRFTLIVLNGFVPVAFVAGLDRIVSH